MRRISIVVLALSLAATTLHAQQPATDRQQLPARQDSVQQPFNGLITTADGRGVKATVYLKNSPYFTFSDRRGRFGFDHVEPGDTLSVLYKRVTCDIPVAGRRALRIVWAGTEPRSVDAPELADYGYGYVKRRSMTQSSNGLSGEELVRRGFTDLVSAITTLVPGVTYQNGRFIIHGGSSVMLSNAALIICDGSPISDVRMVNINSVESVEVVKGANMYGSRGANGVILIRTRRGGTGK